jgi:hypothetical protein
MRHLKESKQAMGAEAIARQDFAPPTIFARLAAALLRASNLLVTTSPAPSSRYRGRVEDFISRLPRPNQALAVAIVSYNGRVKIGLIGDTTMPDLDDLGKEYVRRRPPAAAPRGGGDASEGADHQSTGRRA